MPTNLTRRSFLTAASQQILATSIAGAIQLSPPDKQPANLKIPKPLGKELGYAIVGLGNLALNQIMPAFAVSEKSRPVALVSGHPDKARKVAERYNINPKAIYTYDNYDSMKDNPDIDVVYVVLPNSMHAEYTIRAAKAGKHVLCEKPMCANPVEAQQMIDAAKQAGKQLMVAYRLHFEPFNQTMIAMTRNGAYGKLKLIEASNCQNTQAPNIRLSKALAGGPLGDVGVYCLNATRYISGEEPSEISAMIYQPKDVPRFAEVPESVMWTQRFPSNVLAKCMCSFGTAGAKSYRVVCEDGTYELQDAFGYSGQRLFIRDKNGRHEITLPAVNHFAKMMDHFSDCIMNNTANWTPGEEGLADMKAMAAIEEAGASGKTVQLA